LREKGEKASGTFSSQLLRPWPVLDPQNYLQSLNASQPKEEIENIRYAIQRSRP
jgi:hypothetical protein